MSGVFEGRVVVVTGGASELGRELTRRFEAEGARVVPVDAVPEPGMASLAAGDATACEALVGQVMSRHGRLDVWVNSQAAVEPAASAMELSMATLEACLGSVVGAALVGAQAAARVMLGQGHGVIVNVGTVDAYKAAQGWLAPGLAQAALVRLTEALGVEWAPSGVRVVGVAGASRAAGTAARIPLAREATAAELAEAVLFLAGPEGSYVAGETIRVDGGWSVYQLF